MSKPKTNLHMNTDFINLTNENLTDEQKELIQALIDQYAQRNKEK